MGSMGFTKSPIWHDAELENGESCDVGSTSIITIICHCHSM